MPQRQQQELAIEIVQTGKTKEDALSFPALIALGLERKSLNRLIESIWYYVEELEEDGIEAFKRQYFEKE